MPLYTADDRRWMRRALVLARRGWGQTAPNPMVGAVLVRDGAIVGKGWHAARGAAHAERVALDAAGERARGATLYVTLEPCNHYGLTPPCAPAIIDAGVSRVVYAAGDPNPDARAGAALLRDAGITVDAGLEDDASRALNAAFHHRFSSPRPFVTLKLAVSMDGAVAGAARVPQWLTGERARREVHRMRAGHDAIAVGSGTLLADDPQLTVRHGRKPRTPPARVVFDRRGRTPAQARVVTTARRTPTVVVTSAPVPDSLVRLEARGVALVPAADLQAALVALRGRGIASLLCEGGSSLAGGFVAAGVVDRLVIFRAPVLLGAGAVPAFSYEGTFPGSGSARWQVVEQRRFGDDDMTVYVPVRSA